MSQSDERTPGLLADHLVAAVGFLAALALWAVVWRFGPPGRIPIHMSLSGHVDGWSDRIHVAAVVAGITVLSALGYAAMGRLSGGTTRNLRIARLVLVLVALMTAVILAAAAFGRLNGPDLGPSRLQPAVLALMFLIVGALIGKASPNPLVGVRTYWSLRSRQAWDKSNRLAGRLFFWIGLVGLVASPFAPPVVLVPVLLIGIIATAVIAVVESWRVWRGDPDRRPS